MKRYFSIQQISWLTVIVMGIGTAAVGQEYSLGRYTIDGGGTMPSTGGIYELSASSAQPDAGVLEGGVFELTGGFWFALTPTDCNEDGAANLLDHAALTACLDGPDRAIAGGCACLDIDGSGTIDLADVALAQQYFQGP